MVHPRGQIANNGRVMLPKSKEQKVLKITQNVAALLPNTLLSKDQVLSSLTMHRKTGSSHVVDFLHRLGHGISNYLKNYLSKISGQNGANINQIEFRQILYLVFQQHLCRTILTGKINLSGEVAMRPITQVVYLYNIKKINS